MIKKRFTVFMIALFIIFLAAIANAAFENEIKLLASDGAAADTFGWSVSISGDTAIVGAYYDDDNNVGSGSAYIFVRDPGTGAWTEQQKLLASDGAYQDNFGRSVSISGDTAIAGADQDDDNGSLSGSAYIFVRDPATGVWTEQQKLTASDGAAGDWFGFSVSISGDTAIAGAYRHDDNGTDSGSAYVFVRVAGVWTEQQKLTASDGASQDRFSTSVSIDGDTAIAGASGDDDNGSLSGSAYVFVRDPATGVWTEQQKIITSDGAIQDSFGSSVSISGDTAIAGADQDDDNGSLSGSAYIFVRDPATGVWTEQQKIIASDGADFDRFGVSVSISGDTAIAGAYGDDDNGSGTGAAYVYQGTATGPEITVTDSIGTNNDLSMPFGGVTVGTSSTVETATISNVGTTDLNVSNIQLTGADTGEYNLNLTGGTSPCGNATPTVPAGTNCTVTVTFSPTSTGLKTADLEISSDDADEGTVNVALSGTGTTVTVPEIDVTDSIGTNNDLSMPFGGVTVGTSSTVETATISNVGNADLNVSNIQLTGADTGEYSLNLAGGTSPCGSAAPTVSAGSSCTVTVTFSPTSTGAKTASLEITSDDSDEGTVNVALSGTGDSLQYTVTINGAGTGSGTVTDTGINCTINGGATSGDCTEPYDEDTVVTLTANADAGSVFSGWSGDADCSDGQVTMNQDVNCTATFDITGTGQGPGPGAPDEGRVFIDPYRDSSSYSPGSPAL